MERTRRAEPSAKIDALALPVSGAAIEVHRALGVLQAQQPATIRAMAQPAMTG